MMSDMSVSWGTLTARYPMRVTCRSMAFLAPTSSTTTLRPWPYPEWPAAETPSTSRSASYRAAEASLSASSLESTGDSETARADIWTPWLRSLFVSERVSTPAMPGMPCEYIHSSRVIARFQWLAV